MNRFLISATLLSAAMLVAELVEAQGRSDRAWKNEVFIYGVAAGISGDASYGPISGDVDVSFGDVLDNLQAGFMGAYRGSNERFSIVADVIFLGLGKSDEQGLIRRADLDELIVDFTAGYRFSPVVEVFGGLRVADLSTKVGFGDPLRFEVEGSDTFYDPIFGARARTSLSRNEKWWLQAQGDIGGFGVSMNLTWQVMAHVGFAPTDWRRVAPPWASRDLPRSYAHPGSHCRNAA